MPPAVRCSRTSAPARPKATTRSGPPGSPFSASPQQLAGEPARPTDDIYGLGALAYELLSGYPPFYPAFDAKKIATEPVPRLKPVKPIPPRLELLVSWLLAKQGRERPPSMRHVADEMNAVLQDTLGLEGQPDRRRRGKRSRHPRRRRGQPHAGADGRRNADCPRARCASSKKSIRACCRRSTSCARRWCASSGRATAVAAGPSPRCSSSPRAASPFLLPQVRQPAEGGYRRPAASRRPHRSGTGRGEARRRAHHAAHGTQQAPAGARFARRGAVGRHGLRRRPQVARRNRRHARAPQVRGRAGAARGARQIARRHRGAGCRKR